jgi:hypothetical protein
MREVTRFIRWIDNSSAQAFLAVCNRGDEWIVRLRKKDKNAERLFSEYFTGWLSNEIKLPHPKSEIIQVNHSILPTMPENYEQFDINCDFGIATKFMEKFKQIDTPPNYRDLDLSDDKFKIVNKEHIFNILNANEIKNLYGILIFTKWVIMSDYHKYENLMINANNEVLFLDFDFGLSFQERDYDSKTRYNYFIIDPPFCLGIDEDVSQYNEWIDKIRRVKRKDAEQLISTIPKCWEIEEKLLKGSIEILFDSREKFIDRFIESLEFKFI